MGMKNNMKMVKMFDRHSEISPYMEEKGFPEWFDTDEILYIPGNDCAVSYWIRPDEELEEWRDYEEGNYYEMVKTFNQFFLDNGCKINETVWIDITW